MKIAESAPSALALLEAWPDNVQLLMAEKGWRRPKTSSSTYLAICASSLANDGIDLFGGGHQMAHCDDYGLSDFGAKANEYGGGLIW
ncbi:hypothetical protein L2E82_46997 [Cichorium intybus]|uniref:Uncharacterized protein n=1 Tax=Cichorium intybus TaxID=13427 RepID=A0ACB8YVR5_CICIN|nr:hypothetical protein L2E82_46997 [Cichorium intybus]